MTGTQPEASVDAVDDTVAPSRSRAWLAVEIALIALPVAWLIWAALTVQVEYSDGLDTIVNSRFFAGELDGYLIQRNPMLALALVPALWLESVLALGSRDMRPAHAIMAVLHTAYLVGCLLIMRRYTTWRPALWVAFAVGILSVVFFSYAPFISHDLLPGVLGLAMLALADRMVRKPGVWPWLAMVILGGVAASIKPTYGVFWVGLLIAVALPWIRKDRVEDRPSIRVLASLVAASALSLGIYWILTIWAVRQAIPDAPLLLVPLRQLQIVGSQAQSQFAGTEWLYIEQFWAYGMATIPLLLIGLVVAWRRPRFFTYCAVVWLVGFAAISVFPFREVRYLAFLAPLSACLMIVAIEWLWRGPRRRWLLVPIAVLGLVDITHAVQEAARLRAPFYRENQVHAFLADLGEMPAGELERIGIIGRITMVAPLPSPWRGDLYHRTFSVDVNHLQQPMADVTYYYRDPTDESMSADLANHVAGGIVIMLGAPRNDLRENPEFWPIMEIYGSRPETSLRVGGQGVVRADGAVSIWRHDDGRFLLSSKSVPTTDSTLSTPILCIPGTGRYWRLQPAGGDYVILGLHDATPLSEAAEWEVRGYRTAAILKTTGTSNTMERLGPDKLLPTND